ncbi:MAG TPA: hypothetical protein VJB59_15005 [Bdellovibrionota bacterium]|nr:hypothetical protein [Bdellovibrionota bacterium]
MNSNLAWHSRVTLVLGFAMMVLVSGCGKSTSCVLHGDNLKGRITFAANIPVLTDAPLVVEWSRDSFATVSGRSTSNPNIHGLVSVPYSLCVDNDVNVQVRAYEDINRSTTLEGTEYAGRYDQSSTGDVAFVNVLVPSSPSSTNGENNWEVKEGVDIVIDTP